MATRAQLVEALLRLPAPERAEVARTLLESLSLDDGDDLDEVERAWRGEIAGRVQDIESGAVELEDGTIAMRRLRDHARARFEQRARARTWISDPPAARAQLERAEQRTRAAYARVPAEEATFNPEEWADEDEALRLPGRSRRS